GPGRARDRRRRRRLPRWRRRGRRDRAPADRPAPERGDGARERGPAVSALTSHVRAEALAAVRPLRSGRVTEVLGLRLRARGLVAAVGDLVEVDGPRPVLAEVAAGGPDGLVCLPLGDTAGLAPGVAVRHTGGPLRVPVGDALLGRVLDGL